MKKIKTIRSHVGLSRYMSSWTSMPIGTIPRQENIPSPYRYSPTETVYGMGEKRVFVKETSHKVYEIYEVPADIKLGRKDA